MDDLISIFDAAARRFSDKPALIGRKGESVSFAVLRASSEGLAARLAARGLGKGARVLVALPVGVRLYAALAALWRIGAVAVFPEPALGLKGLRAAISISMPEAVIASGRYRLLKLLPPLWGLPMIVPRAGDKGRWRNVPLGESDAALISFTSGSTGAPKAILRSHGFLLAQHRAVLPMLGDDPAPRDLVAFPVFALVNLALGRTTVLPDWRQAEQVTGAALAARIEKTGATRLLLTPALCEALAEHGLPPRTSAIFTGGGPVFPDIVARLGAGRSDLKVVTVYGSTEAEPIAHLDARDVSEEDRAAMEGGRGLLAGHPVPEARVRVVYDEIQVAGAHVNRGYLDPARDAETKVAEGGTIWHRTGDAGRIDGEGRLWLLGRLSAALPGPGGTKLFPFGIETAARIWPGVRRAALASLAGEAVLAIEGDPVYLGTWRQLAQALGIARVIRLHALPMDRRHRSKVDYPALARAVRNAE